MRARRILMLCTALALCAQCAVPALALDVAPTLAERMAAFMAEYGLTEQSFSVCYYDTVTGEEYRFNDTRFMFAASTYKLPLNMYYYEMEQAGLIASDAPVEDATLADAHYKSLVLSDNDLSMAMLHGLGTFRAYKDAMRTYFTMDADQIPTAYYAGNYYCTAMMLDALRYLYENSERFDEMLGYMKQAQPGLYFKTYVSDYEIAHKYGYFLDDGIDDDEEQTGTGPDAAAAVDGAAASPDAAPAVTVLTVNDVGIVYTPQPFLLAVYTTGAEHPEEAVARACELFTAYNLEQYEARIAAEQASAEQTAAEQADSGPPDAAPNAGQAAAEPGGALDGDPAEDASAGAPADASPETEAPPASGEAPADRTLLWASLSFGSICAICILILILAARGSRVKRGNRVTRS